MLKILYISRGYQFFQISQGIKSLYDRDRKLIHVLAGEAQFGAGKVISANLSIGEVTVAHFTGELGQGVSVSQFNLF